MTESLRDKIRGSIFATRELKRLRVEFFGEFIELRQPTLDDIIAGEGKSHQDGIIGLLVRYAYVPDSDERLFEDSDADAFRAMPFGSDFNRIAKAFEELTEVNFIVPNSGSNSNQSSSG